MKPTRRVLVDGQEPLIKVGVSPEWAQALEDVAKSRIRIHRVKIRGTLQMTSSGSKGVEILHEAFQKALSVRKPKSVQVEIYAIGPPRYRIEVVAENFKQAERILDSAVQAAVETMTSQGGEGKFTRKDGQE
jgi:translation initiation factor 2 subunit 1